MKKNRNRQTAKNRRLDRVTEISVPTNDVLPDIRATRDAADDHIMPLSHRVDDEYAIDRLLVHSGFEKSPDTRMHPDKSTKAWAAVDDFEPDMANRYRVEALDFNGHQQVRPLMEANLEVQDLALQADRHEDSALTSEKPEAVGGVFADVECNGLLAESANDGLPDEAIEAGLPLTAEVPGPISPEPIPGRIDPIIEPIIFAPSGPEELPIVPIATAYDIPSPPSTKPAPQPVFASRKDSLPSEHKTEHARINLITLILSIVASLSTVVFYFLLMDIKEDVIKLNEIVEIMKEDVQMIHPEPPTE